MHFSVNYRNLDNNEKLFCVEIHYEKKKNINTKTERKCLFLPEYYPVKKNYHFRELIKRYFSIF